MSTLHTPESLLALTKSPEGLEQLRIIAAEADGWTKRCGCKFPECDRKKGNLLIDPVLKTARIPPNYLTSLDAIFAAEERLGFHEPDAFALREIWLGLAAFVIREGKRHRLTTNSAAFLPPPFRLIVYILTAQWKEQNL